MNEKPQKNKRGGPRPNSGRPSVYREPRAVISASVAGSLAVCVRDHATDSGQTVSEIVGASLTEYLEKRNISKVVDA
jgi:hypothetical protein